MKPVSKNLKDWWKSGTPWIWLNAGAVSASIVIVFGLLLLIAVRGMGHFWAADIQQISYGDKTQPQRLIGELVESEFISRERYMESGLGQASDSQADIKRWLLKTGIREQISADFRWINDHEIHSMEQPEHLIVVERVEWGNFYGYLQKIQQNNTPVAEGEGAWEALEQRLERVTSYVTDTQA